MKSLKIIGLLTLMAFIGFSFTNPVDVVETIKVNPQESVVTWKGYKVTGQHEGTIAIKEGNLEYAKGDLTGGSFAIDMTTISTTDLQGEWKGKLDGHLKSPDFFNVAEFPVATLKIKKVAPRGKQGEYKVTGDLTIKGKTKEIRFNATIIEENGIKVAKADVKIDRSDFDVRYGSGSFFDNLGDKTIYDEFDLAILLKTE